MSAPAAPPPSTSTPVWRGHPSYRSFYMVRKVFTALTVLLVASLILIVAWKTGAIPRSAGVMANAFVALLAFAAVEIQRRTTVYTISGRGVSYQHGILYRRGGEIHFSKLQQIDVRETLIERFILRTGTIVITSATPDADDDVNFHGITQPFRVREMIREGEDNLAQHRGGPGPQGYSTQDIAQRYGHGTPPQQPPPGWTPPGQPPASGPPNAPWGPPPGSGGWQ